MNRQSDLATIASKFAECFTRREVRLPESNLQEREPGEIHDQGLIIGFCFGEDSRGEYLDFYAQHRVAGDWHCRIHADGTMEDLDVYLYFLPLHPDAAEEDKREAQRQFDEHNERVRRELERKGLPQ